MKWKRSKEDIILLLKERQKEDLPHTLEFLKDERRRVRAPVMLREVSDEDVEVCLVRGSAEPFRIPLTDLISIDGERL